MSGSKSWYLEWGSDGPPRLPGARLPTVSRLVKALFQSWLGQFYIWDLKFPRPHLFCCPSPNAKGECARRPVLLEQKVSITPGRGAHPEVICWRSTLFSPPFLWGDSLFLRQTWVRGSWCLSGFCLPNWCGPFWSCSLWPHPLLLDSPCFQELLFTWDWTLDV